MVIFTGKAKLIHDMQAALLSNFKYLLQSSKTLGFRKKADRIYLFLTFTSTCFLTFLSEIEKTFWLILQFLEKYFSGNRLNLTKLKNKQTKTTEEQVLYNGKRCIFNNMSCHQALHSTPYALIILFFFFPQICLYITYITIAQSRCRI